MPSESGFMGKIKSFWNDEMKHPGKRQQNQRFARNVCMFVVSIYAIKKYGHLLLDSQAL
jgi:hypothetical protein